MIERQLAKYESITIDYGVTKGVHKLNLILVMNDEIQQRISKALKDGHTIIYKEDGRKEFIDDLVIFVPREEDMSKRYIWSKDGERCKHNRCLVTIHKDGTRTEVVLKTVWKSICN